LAYHKAEDADLHHLQIKDQELRKTLKLKQSNLISLETQFKKVVRIKKRRQKMNKNLREELPL
jgi:Tfp pilus assembly protein PilO